MSRTNATTRRFLLFLSTVFCLTAICYPLLSASADNGKEEKAWKQWLSGEWEVKFQDDPIVHPVTLLFNKGKLSGTYKTKSGMSLPLKGVVLVPPHPVPQGVDPERNPIQEEFYNCWRLYFDVPMSPEDIVCRFDLYKQGVLSGHARYAGRGSGGKGEGGSGGTYARLTRKK